MSTNIWVELGGGGSGSGSWKGVVATAGDLPTSGNTAGDARATADTGIVYVWDGATWVPQSGGTPIGSSNTFAGFNNVGALQSIPGFAIDVASGGMNENLTEHPNNGGGSTVNGFSVSFEPLQNSPNENWNIQSIQVFMDSASSGFSQGTAGNAVQLIDLGFTHQGTGNTGYLDYITMNNNLGNGTDPITIGGLSYCYAGANVHSGVTINGQISGFNFNPTMLAGSISGASQGTQAFWDGAQILVPENQHTSFIGQPTINQINNTHNYNGLILSPNITTLQGNAGVLGMSISPTITTMGATSGYQGVNVAGAITTSHGSITGVNISPTVSGGDASFQGLNIQPNGGVTFNGAQAININMAGVNTTDPQGMVGLQSDSRISVNATTQLQAAQGFQIGSRLEHLFSVPNGSPVTGTDELAVNIAGDFLVQDDVANGAFGIGFNSVGFIASMGIAATKTVDSITVFLPASSLPDPGFATGGNVTEFHMIREFLPLPQGGTANITNLYGFKIDNLFGDFGSAATNAWGLYIDSDLSDNYFGKSLAVATANKKASTNVRVEYADGHLRSRQTTPPATTTNANAGTGASSSVSQATDSGGRLTLTVGTGSFAAGEQVKVTFNKPYNVAPIVVLYPLNALTAQDSGSFHQIYVSSTVNDFSVNFGVQANTASAVYLWNYMVLETEA